MKFFILSIYILTSTFLNAEMRKGPYLIYPNDETKMTVLWQLTLTEESTIEWGSDIKYSIGSAKSNELMAGDNGHIHSFTITGLTPNKKYYYRVKESTKVHTGTFKTGNDFGLDTTRILVYGDTRTELTKHNIVARSITEFINKNPKWQTMILHCGDWNSNDEEITWDSEHFNPNYYYIKELLSELPVMGTRGNHEQSATNYNKYYRYDYVEEGKSYYSFDYGLAHISIVDQYVAYGPGSAQYDWLKNDLMTTNKKWKIMLFHEPAYSDLGKRPDNKFTRLYLQPLFEKYGVKLVFAGHNHFYAHNLINGVNHFTFGGGGSELHQVNNIGEGLQKSITSYNYGRISLTENGFNVTALDPDGNILDNVGMDITTDYESNKKLKTDVYPNPSSNIIYYNLPQQTTQNKATLFDNMGKSIIETVTQNTNYGNMDVSQISQGQYILVIETNNGTHTQSVSVIR